MLRKILVGLFIVASVVKADINSGKRAVDGYLKSQGASFTSFRSQRNERGFYVYEGLATVRGTRVVFLAVVDKNNNILDMQIYRE